MWSHPSSIAIRSAVNLARDVAAWVAGRFARVRASRRGWAIPLLLVIAACDAPRLTPLSADGAILAFGDSLTYGTGAATKQSYPTVLAELTGRPVINAGVPGEISATGANRLPEVLAQHAPELLVLIHGGNDTLRNLRPDDTRANLKRMIETSRESGAQVVLLAVPGRNLTLSAPAYYEEVAEELDVPIDSSVLPRLMRDRAMKSDPVHFNAEGYRRLAQGVYELLQDEGALKHGAFSDS